MPSARDREIGDRTRQDRKRREDCVRNMWDSRFIRRALLGLGALGAAMAIAQATDKIANQSYFFMNINKIKVAS